MKVDSFKKITDFAIIRRMICTICVNCLMPALSFAFFCPGNFNQIDFGMTPDQVMQICGKPDDMKTSVRENDNVPQEWDYYIPQTVSMGGTQQSAQGTLKTSMTFDDRGKAINISVNGIGVGSTTICGANIQLGDDKERIKSACGKPSFINKQSSDVNATATTSGNTQQYTPITEFKYTKTSPPLTLIFENGKLAEKK